MRFLITTILLSIWTYSFSQSATCADPSPLCVLSTHDYPIGSNISLDSGNNYGCISHTTNGVPALLGYFYAEVRGAGPIELKFDSQNNLSVAAWGPFASQAAVGAACGSLPAPIACSADPYSASETITINGQVGEFYLILVKGLAPPAYVGQFSVQQTNSGPGVGGLACNGFGNQFIACPTNVIIAECEDEIPSPADNIFEFLSTGGNADNLCTDRVAITSSDSENGGNGCAGNPRILERRYFLQDQCGNLATCTQQFTYPLFDEPLDLVCPPSDAPSQLVTCLDDLEVNVQDILAMNACGLTLDFDIGEPQINDASLGIECDLTCLHYPITVTDECGRTGECTLSFTVFGNVPEFVYDESEEDEECRLAPLVIECRDGVEEGLENYLDTLSVFSTCGNRLDLDTDFDLNSFVDVCSEDVFQSQEITITATDACGRTNSCRAIINISKEEGPIIASPAKDKWVTCAENADSIFQEYIADNGGAIAIDFCSVTTFTTNPANPEFFISCNDGDPGVFIEFIASDACGNTSVTVGQFKVFNTDPPVITNEASDVVVDCTDNVDELFNNFLATQGGAEVNGCGNIIYTTSPAQPSAPSLNNQCDEATTEVTFIGTDECGQMVTTTATFTIFDDVAPSMTSGDDLILECNADTNLDQINMWLGNNADIVATDECSLATITNDFDPASLDVDCHMDPIVVTFTATDVCGNETTQTVTITITDNTPPIFTSIPTQLGEDPVAEDECSDVTITSTKETNGGQTIVTYTAIDACGNETSVTVTFGEVDNTPPVITFIPPTVGCDGVLDPNDVIATDDSGMVSITVTLISETGSCDMGYVFVYEVTATDSAGNTTTETVTYNVPADNTPPIFTSVPEDMTFTCSDEVIIPEATATDDCDDVTITCTVTLNDGAVVDDCNNGYGYDIFKVWTATDACGNTATAVTQAWVVPDDYTAPRFEFVPESTVMECGDDATFGDAVCTTACGNVVLTFVDEISQGDCTQAGEMIRTWTGVDDCGNTATAQQIITIPPDTEAPIFTFVPESKTIAHLDDMEFGEPTCIDNCATISHLDIVFTDHPLEDGCGLTRTWVVADLCGNASEASQTFFLDDNIAPSIGGVQANIEINCGTQMEFTEPIITDNSGAVDIAITDGESTSSCTGIQELTRTWTATDVCGNVNQFTQTITSTDNEAPIFADLQSEKIVSCDDSFEFDQAIATDACTEIQSLDYTDVDISDENCTGCIFKVIRTWEAIDACGNRATISQTVTLIDQDAPSITLGGANIIEFNCGEELSIEAPTAIDNCGDVAITFEDVDDESQCSNGSSFTRTWIATDNVGNQSIAIQQYVFTDNEAPTFSEVPTEIEVECIEDLQFIAPEITDNCSEVEVVIDEESVNTVCGDGTMKIRVWKATDNCGNNSRFVQSVIVKNDTAPVFDQILNVIQLTCGEEIPAATEVTATDNCGEEIIVVLAEVVHPDSDCSDSAIITRTYTATDACGNQATMSYEILREIDDEGPESITIIEDREIFCGEEVQFDTPTFLDNCSANLDITSNTVVEEDPCGTSHTRTWIASDDCGNATEIAQRIFWTDTEAPEILLPLALEMTLEEYLLWSLDPQVAVEDHCSGVDNTLTQITNEQTGTCEDFSVTYTYSVADLCGNASTVDFEVTVDDALPSFSFDAPTEVDCGSTFTVSALEIDNDAHDFEWTIEDPTGTWEFVITDNNQIEITAGDESIEVVLTVINELGCSTTEVQAISCAGANAVNDLNAIDLLELRPNPVADVLTIQFNSSDFIDAKIIVYDLLGRVISHQDYTISTGANQFEVNASKLEQGTYILEIATDQGSAVRKFMKF